MWKTRVAIITALPLAICAGAMCVAPAHAAFDAIMSCAKSSACLEWDNSSSGNAIKGVSSHGDAIHGQTKFNSAGKSAGKSGVLGEDLSTSGTLNAGVRGVSTNGPGVVGTSSTYNAVEGFSTNSTGVYGEAASSSGFGVAGRNTSSTYNAGSGVYADGGPANDGMQAFSNLRSGVYAFSQSGTALYGNDGQSDSASELVLQDSGSTPNDAIQVYGQSGDVFDVKNGGNVAISGETAISHSSYPALKVSGESIEADGNQDTGIYATSTTYSAAVFQNLAGDSDNVLYLHGGVVGTGQSTFQIGDGNNNGVLTVTDTGNLYITGILYTSGSCKFGCLEGDKQVRAVSTYAPSEAEPTIEDTGEAALVDGRADVALDPQFANIVDSNKGYVVLLTPEGDCRGLYVTRRAASSFVVRELQGGRSSIGFAYRIVAKRFGVNATRLPMTIVKPILASQPRRVRHH
jgi:hypothetical protein